MSVSPPAPDRSTPMARLIDECTRDLGSPWRSRNRYESAALGAIELAFRRGYQAGFEAQRTEPRSRRRKMTEISKT